MRQQFCFQNFLQDAGDKMTRGNLFHRDILPETVRPDMRAARREPAAGFGIYRAGHFSLQQFSPFMKAFDAWDRDSSQQCPGGV